MPGTTPVYGFPYPEPTDLVADYPALGQQLAEDIEDILPTLGGLRLVASQFFDQVSSVSVNNCFTGTYSNYAVILHLIGYTSANALNMRMRASGSDNSSSNYHYQKVEIQTTSVSAARTTSATSLRVGVVDSQNWTGIQIGVFAPAGAIPTLINAIGSNRTVSEPHIEQDFGSYGAATAFDGFTLFPASGNFGGTVRVYGLRNS